MTTEPIYCPKCIAELCVQIISGQVAWISEVPE